MFRVEKTKVLFLFSHMQIVGFLMGRLVYC